MTDIKTSLETFAAKCAFIKAAKQSKTVAGRDVDAATDAAILAAIAIGDACNGALPDKRVLQKQFPDAVVWKDVPANLLTYARLIMEGEGETVTIGRGDNAQAYTVQRATLESAPGRLSTVATNLRDLFKVKAEQAAIHDELSQVTAVQVISESPVMAERYTDAATLEKAVDMATLAEEKGIPHDAELLTAWRSAYSDAESNRVAQQAAQAERDAIAQVVAAFAALSPDARTTAFIEIADVESARDVAPLQAVA